MKIIKRGNFSNTFPMNVTCEYFNDEYGFSYGKREDFCGSELEIVASDIVKREWFKYPDYSGTDYGVVCPVCHSFIVIAKNKLPSYVISNAKKITDISDCDNYTWKDIVKIHDEIYAEEFHISGKMDGENYDIGDFLSSVADKYDVDVDDVKTYMMDNIEFDPKGLPYGAEECGCYINGVAEWIVK